MAALNKYMSAKTAVLVKPRSRDLVEHIVQQIDRMIGSEQLKPGDTISEPDLCVALGVGRVPAREALRILAGEGLIELIPNKSARVKRVDGIQILEMLEVLNGMSAIAIQLMVRAPIEKRVIECLNNIAEEIVGEGATKDPLRILKRITQYHYVLFKECGNLYLFDLVQKTRINYYTKSLVLIIGGVAFFDAVPRYRKITAALERHDAGTAIRHLNKIVERMFACKVTPLR